MKRHWTHWFQRPRWFAEALQVSGLCPCCRPEPPFCGCGLPMLFDSDGEPFCPQMQAEIEALIQDHARRTRQ